MKYAIIAAGEGSRLAAEGIALPKPLVEVDGQPLIDRLLRIFLDNDAEEIVVICNDLTPLVADHLRQLQSQELFGTGVPLKLVVKSTPSSMHSFFELSRHLVGGPFCMTTVDTIFRPEEFKSYIHAFRMAVAQGEVEGMMGVTDYIEDEKPLYVETDKYISGGIYGLAESALDTLNRCMERGESRMRNFQRALIADGRRLRAYAFSKVLDIDHASDILQAERFLQETR